MLPRILSRVVGWSRVHHLYSLEFEDRSVTLWAFIRMWEKDTFRRVAVTVSDSFSSKTTHKLSVFVSVVAAVGSSASPVTVFCGSHLLVDTYGDYLGSGYNRKMVEYPIFDFVLLKRCLQKDITFFLWIFGWVLDDGNFCHAFEGARALGMEDVTFRSSSCYHYRGDVDSVASWGRQQHCGCLASHRCLLQRDWEKDWRRQLSGMIHFAIFFRLQFLSYAQPVFFFGLEERNRWLFSYWPDAKKQFSTFSPDSWNLSVKFLAYSSSDSRSYVSIQETHQQILGSMWHHS